MLKKTLTYTDYDGNERKEDFYFNLTKAELMELELSYEGGLSKMVEIIIQKQNIPLIVNIFKDLLLRSYGEKSLDGKRFVKTPEITESFKQTEAYSDFFTTLLSNADEAAAFITGIVPANIQQQMTKTPHIQG